jgi:peroxiredoxin
MGSAIGSSHGEKKMTISIGDKIPSTVMNQMTSDGPAELSSEELFGGKKVVLFALPGAFTPTCSASHLPGFVANADKIKAKGVDDIVCLSVNDAWVMDAWGKDQNADEIHMVADGSANFTQAVRALTALRHDRRGRRGHRIGRGRAGEIRKKQCRGHVGIASGSGLIAIPHLFDASLSARRVVSGSR